MYIADPAYHAANRGQYNPNTFSGQVIYTDVNGKFTTGYKITNGVAVDSVIAQKVDRNGLGVRWCIIYELCFCDCPFKRNCETFAVCGRDELGGSSYHIGNNSDGGWDSGGGGSIDNSGTWGSNQPPLDPDMVIFYKFRLVGRGVISLQEFTLLVQNTPNEVAAAFNFLTDNNYSPESKGLVGLHVRLILNNLSYENGGVSRVSNVWNRYKSLGFTFDEFAQVFSNNSLFQQVNFFLSNSTLSQNAKTAVAQKHLLSLRTEPDYTLFNEEEGWPEDVLGMLRAYITVPNECTCKTIAYELIGNEVAIRSSYTPVVPWWSSMMVGNPPPEIAIIPKEHPNYDYLVRTRLSISRALDDQSGPNTDLRWVYHLKKNPIPNPSGFLCKSCITPPALSYITLLQSETYKFGIALDKGDFQSSMEYRYQASEKFLLGLTSFQYFMVVPSPNANMYAEQITPYPVREKVALLIEKILIFNYILNSPQKTIMSARGITTKNGLPVGLAIGK